MVSLVLGLLVRVRVRVASQDVDNGATIMNITVRARVSLVIVAAMWVSDG